MIKGPETPYGAHHQSLDEILVAFGRIGGPTEHGWHTLEPMFSCWRLHNFKKNATSNGHTSKALAVGSILHEFLAIYYAPHIIDLASRPKIAGSVDSLYNHIKQTEYSEEADEAKRLLDAYLSYYEGRDGYLSKSVEIVGIEVPLQRTLPWGAPYTVRLDMVLKLPDGYWAVDHKTTWAKTTEFVEGWQVDPGIIGAMWAASETFSPLRGASINGVIKTKVPEFDRFTFAFDEGITADWQRMLEYKMAEQPLARLAGWPPNFKACFGKWGRCGYFERCVYGVGADQP